MKDWIIGIDPGLTGAAVMYDPEKKLVVDLMDMPIVSVKVGKTIRSEVNAAELHRALGTMKLCALSNGRVLTATVEKVHSMPSMAASSVFSLGRSVGVLHGVLAAHEIPMELVDPSKWKKDMGLGKDKGLSRKMATDLIPSASAYFNRVKDDGRAEAALLAIWSTKRSVTWPS